jgi:hypothetical protein
VCGPVYIDFNVNRTIGPGQPPSVFVRPNSLAMALGSSTTPGRRYDCVVSSSCDCTFTYGQHYFYFHYHRIVLSSFRLFLSVPLLLQVGSYQLQ